jgi:hypothetical protein
MLVAQVPPANSLTIARASFHSTALLAAPLLLSACPSPTTYTVPRTLEPGDLQFLLAEEGYGYSGNVTTASSPGTNSATRIATVTAQPPTFGIRYGVASGFEVGARVANLDSLAADLKVRLLRGTFDLAVDPGLQVMDLTASPNDADQHVGILNLYAPLLAGLNVSDGLTLLTSLGVTYSAATAVPEGGSPAEVSGAQTGPWARVGLGIDIHPSEKIAWHPEATCSIGLGAIQGVGCTVGLGLLFGGQPSYADLAPPQ